MELVLNKEQKNKLEYQYEAQRIIIKDHKKIISNPNIKILSWKNYKIIVALAIIFTLLLIALAFLWKSIFFTIFAVAYFVIVVGIMFINIRFVKAVKEKYKTKTDTVLNITKEEINGDLGKGLMYKVKWSDVEFILISHYSIGIITKIGTTPITISKDYKDELFEILEKEKIDVKVIDNSNAYN